MLSLLIVEDSAEKSAALRNLLKELEDLAPHVVDFADNVRDAKVLLRDKKYDLMILDLVLPRMKGSEPLSDGGAQLLEELRDRDNYMVPREVVGLTAYDSLSEQVTNLFSQDVWSIVHYDPASKEWSNQIGRKLLHLSLSVLSTVPLEYRSYACIVTALPEPELSMVLRIPWGWNRHQVDGDVTDYFAGSVSVGGRQERVIAAAAANMGLANTAVLAAKMCELFRPKYLAIVGITAGLRDRVNIGDIIAADPSWDWGSGKLSRNGENSEFLQAPYQIPLHSSVRMRVARMSGDHALMDQIRTRWGGPKPESALNLRIGPVASGAAVLADSTIVKDIGRQHRKLLAIEMEIYGAYCAAMESRLPQPHVFALKSVCDFADERKDDQYQAYAAYTSAQALQNLIEKYL